MTSEFEKPRKFRDRSKTHTRPTVFKEDELHHPVHRPYERDNSSWRRNITIDGRGDYEDGDSGTDEAKCPLDTSDEGNGD